MKKKMSRWEFNEKKKDEPQSQYVHRPEFKHINFVQGQRRTAGELELEEGSHRERTGWERRDTKRGCERDWVSYKFLHPSVCQKIMACLHAIIIALSLLDRFPLNADMLHQYFSPLVLLLFH